ncbi:putative cytochrome P450 [Polyplosphaeria fusca]|uniref:Cytochrome P450 n=1 Tax=Polyplosphaeria fusca TaxID=682080 RepID=A0A9P4QNK7_9PLEO|nr:putative cytochrome P450 [Polyplosphaeria fusca]
MASQEVLNAVPTVSPIWGELPHFNASTIGRFNAALPAFVVNNQTLLSKLSLYLLLAIPLLLYANKKAEYDDGIPLLNRKFALEPRIFARFRWAFNSRKILDEGYAKYRDQPYRLAKGHADVLVLPEPWIHELNKLPLHCISSRKSHSTSLTGYLNGMDVVKETGHHVKMLLSRVTPALPVLLPNVSKRVQTTINDNFPKQGEDWKPVKPVQEIVLCIAQAVTVSLFGPPICDTPELVELCYVFTENVFSIMFVMRFVPYFLQHALVWLTPFKWRLERNWKQLEGFVMPEARKRKETPGLVKEPNLLSWMIDEAKSEEETDPWMLTRLIGSVIAGGTYSSAAFISGVIADLVNSPDALAEIQEEIRETHARINGQWDMDAFNSLDKLDSAMKETSRLAPGSLLVYSRYVEEDCTLSNGTQLKKGQFITTSGHSTAHDADLFPDPEKYDALRYYNGNLEKHRAQPFRSVEGEDHRWGAGRWACPGRFIASVVSKMILVKLLDEYDFKFTDGKRPATSVVHEFVFMDPGTKIMMRRKEKSSGIVY